MVNLKRKSDENIILKWILKYAKLTVTITVTRAAPIFLWPTSANQVYAASLFRFLNHIHPVGLP
jgi:hypothetical protein